MKPLELRIYEKHPTADAYKFGPSYTPTCLAVTEKRFSDAELAAEFQFARLTSFVRHRRTQNCPGDMTLFDHYEKGLDQEWIIERFATLPHYDEVSL